MKILQTFKDTMDITDIHNTIYVQWHPSFTRWLELRGTRLNGKYHESNVDNHEEFKRIQR